MIKLLSVPHSGTRFTRDALVRAGLKPSVDFLQQHFTGYNNHWIINEKMDCVTIIPQREKSEVIASWERRGRKDPNFDSCWAEMEKFIADNDDVYILHVDDPERRESELQAISERIGIPLEADFSVKVGHGI